MTDFTANDKPNSEKLRTPILTYWYTWTLKGGEERQKWPAKRFQKCEEKQCSQNDSSETCFRGITAFSNPLGCDGQNDGVAAPQRGAPSG